MKFDEKQITDILNKQTTKDNEVNVSLEDVESFGNKQSIKEMFGDISRYNDMLREKITFVNDSLTKVIPFTKENLYLICAFTGSGKSTLAANVSWPLFKQQKKTLIIANEESKQDILFRIGCLEKGYSFNAFKKGTMPIEQQRDIMVLFPEISKYVKVLDVNYKQGLTCKIEGIKSALESVKAADYSCVMIDYFQNIKFSVNDSSRKTYDVLSDLKTYLMRYIKDSNCPVVLFAQLYSLGKRASKDIDARIKECTNITEAATVILELVPDYDTCTSDIIIHKDRFGVAGYRIKMGFDNGRYVVYNDDFQQKILQNNVDIINAKIEGLSKLKDEEDE